MRIGVDVVKFSDKCTKRDAANKNTEKNASVDTFMQDSCLNAKPCHPHPDISSHLFQYQLIHVHTRLQWHRLRQAKHQQIKSVQCKEQFPWYPNALLNLTWSFFLPLKVIIKKNSLLSSTDIVMSICKHWFTDCVKKRKYDIRCVLLSVKEKGCCYCCFYQEKVAITACNRSF